MERVVKFGNPGVIDPRVWTTFGVSVKEGDSPIGQFGTGLKYAIAVLMREGRSLTVKTGGETYIFGVETADIRGKEFAQITCNGQPMPYTTHLGHKWELWMAYRELFSNCLDEGGALGMESDTVIEAELGDINHDDVFIDPAKHRLVASSRKCDIYAGRSRWIYYRGIKAYEMPRPAMYTYDIKKADLTEDRTIKYTIDIYDAIGDVVLSSEDRDFLFNFILQSRESYEETVSFDYTLAQPSEACLEIVSQYLRESVYIHPGVSKKALAVLGSVPFTPEPMDSRQQRIVEKASDFCAKIGYPIHFPVHLSRELGRSTLGLADRKSMSIYLSDTVLTQGTKQVASTLIEENLHLSKGLDDCTYEMQSYLFDQIVTMGESLTGEIL